MFEEFQEEVFEWSEENFPGQPSHNPYLGIDEEFGELVEETSGQTPTEFEFDCVGDMLVYLADFCGRRGLDMEKAYDERVRVEDISGLEPEQLSEDPLRNVQIAKGRIARSILKQNQGIRLNEDRVGEEAEQKAVSLLIRSLEKFAESRGYTLREAVQAAWYDEVIERDWDSSYRE